MFRNLRPFELLRPKTMEEAIALLNRRGQEVKVMAGGRPDPFDEEGGVEARLFVEPEPDRRLEGNPVWRGGRAEVGFPVHNSRNREVPGGQESISILARLRHCWARQRSETAEQLAEICAMQRHLPIWPHRFWRWGPRSPSCRARERDSCL